MELKSSRKKMELNPELEALRIKGLKENVAETNDWILRMIRRTSRIHAGFLFEDRKTLQNLCLFIGETQSKITDAGWEAFGYHLGLSPSVLKVINYNNFNKEDPCYNVFLVYVQNENASIGKIIQALYDIGRIDVLSRVQNSINQLADILQLNINSEENTSDYGSLTSSEGNNSSNLRDNNSSSSHIGNLNNVFIRPKIIPPAPFIFQNIQGTPEITSLQIQQAVGNILLSAFPNCNNNDNEDENRNKCSNNEKITKKITCIDNFYEGQKIKLVTEPVQSQSITGYYKKNFVTSKKRNYSLKILLTFSEDGEKYATEASRLFRQKRENFSDIGVLILSEHADMVNKDPLEFISEAFSQVDYICPILTSGYFDLVTKKKKVSTISNMHIDAIYVPYIYRLMNSYFVANNCLNHKIRSIIPENEFHSIPCKSLWANPIFGAWVKLCEVEELALRLLKSKKNCK